MSITPGPWIDNEYSDVSSLETGEAVTITINTTITTSRQEANARLIAAAPEIAEVLRDVATRAYVILRRIEGEEEPI